jgi:hypothetical protein
VQGPRGLAEEVGGWGFCPERRQERSAPGPGPAMISRHDLAPSVGPFIAHTRALAVVAAAPVLYLCLQVCGRRQRTRSTKYRSVVRRCNDTVSTRSLPPENSSLWRYCTAVPHSVSRPVPGPLLQSRCLPDASLPRKEVSGCIRLHGRKRSRLGNIQDRRSKYIFPKCSLQSWQVSPGRKSGGSLALLPKACHDVRQTP